jgi:sec-independent protein translocase protein TatA
MSNLNFILDLIPRGMEWIPILAVVLLFFGGKKIPDLMRGIGKGISEFNKAKNDMKQEIENGMSDKEKSEEKK